MERWKGKVAVVTGASAGIGAAIAEKLVEEGLKVVGMARRKERIEALAATLDGKPGKLYAYKVDMTQQDEILQAFRWVQENVGPVHILVNNAGLSRKTTIINGNIEDWKRILDTNVLGLAVASREALRIMQETGIDDGHIVNINSVAGHQVAPLPFQNVYPASKYAVTAFTETLRKELVAIKSNIKVSSVSPGKVDTEIFAVNGFLESEEVLKLLSLAPGLKSEDVANAVVYVLGTPRHVQIAELAIMSGLGSINIPLEPIEVPLPEFDGTTDEWLTYKSNYESLIHSNTSISDAVKLCYLRSGLKGEAAEIIRYYLSKDYEQAWKSVCDRYHDVPGLIKAHLNKLFNLPVLTRESGNDLWQMAVNIMVQLDHLKSLNLPVEHWDVPLLYFLEQKLDRATRYSWVEHCVCELKDELPTVEGFKKFLFKTASTLDVLKGASADAALECCPVCEGSHRIYHCEEFLELSSEGRYEEAKRLRLCVNCLRANHKTRDCRSGNCKKCRGRHSTLLHFQRK
ncbi:hypothetical protein NQ315_007425 [Exocentrus adspersus]|uniref:Dehydrogenase/reductase SDR family member 11 n=1 Tax=Exocentrus adspersus TaxID=1586481 RepID=A0AAV8VHN1_9CUCU|nr:hypothetical protein NQ315_007425 [Exocentrus adspersus]